MTRFNEVKKIKPDEELVKEIHEQAKNIETKSDSDKKDNFGKKRFVINIDFGLKGKRDFSFELKIDALNIEAAKKEVYEDLKEKFRNKYTNYIFNDNTYEMISKKDVTFFTVEEDM